MKIIKPNNKKMQLKNSKPSNSKNQTKLFTKHRYIDHIDLFD